MDQGVKKVPSPEEAREVLLLRVQLEDILIKTSWSIISVGSVPK